jgi:outer membrane protein OmpA-like peptidoglycan-associated protein
MVRYLLFFLLFSFTKSFAQQPDFSGDWIGILRQEGGALSEIYEFSISITQDKNGNLTGISKIHINDARDYGIMSLKGKASPKGISVQELKVEEQTIRTNFYWCIKNYILKYDHNTETLSGNWTAGGGCPPGTIELTRPKKITSINKRTKQNKNPEEIKPTITEARAEINPEKLSNPIADLPPNYLSMEAIKTDLKNKKSITGKKVILENVYFQQSSSRMLADADKTLLEVVNFLKENPALKIKINGHTDNVGKEHSNKHLSQLRATVIMNFLINRGIDENKISAQGFGSTFPIRPNDTEDNKKQNRRVEFEIL